MATGAVEVKKTRWGTWEELVLACAVKRYGTKSWDFVAAEVKTRTSVRFDLSAMDCLEKYRDLERRFGSRGEGGKGGEEEEDGESERRIPWLEELRKIRVDELKREVERYDVSIVSLQLKLKKLKEDHNRTVSETENRPVKSEPEKEGCRQHETSRYNHEESHHKTDEGKVEPPVETNGTVPETKPTDPERLINDSTLENRSFNESNSTEEKPEHGGPEPDRLEESRPDPAGDSPTTEERSDGSPASPSESFNGSSETISKDPSSRRTLSSEARPKEIGDVYSATKEGLGPSNEYSAESEDRDVEQDDTAKDSSEGQSSVHPSKRRRTGPPSVDDDERASETASAGVSQVPPNALRSDGGEIQRLIDHLDTVRSHRYGRVFERRLNSQDSNHYRSLVRNHVDLGTVGTRVEEGHYAGVLEFFRDLLLLINNALVFFPKSSPESGAACKLRELLKRSMTPSTGANQKMDRKEEASPSSDTKERSKPTSEVPDLQPSKPSISPPVVARKRSNLGPTQSSELPPNKAPKAEPESIHRETTEISETPEPVKGKEPEKETKKLPAKGSRTNKRRAPISSAKNSVNTSSNLHNATPASNNTSPNLMVSSAAVLKDTGVQKTELPSKKRSAAAANFLNRMKRNVGNSATETTSAAGSLLESLKKLDGVGRGKGGDQRRGRKEPVGVGRQKQVKTPPAAPPPRRVGRPPKKGPAAKQRASKEVAVAAPPPAAARTARKRARR